MAYRIKCISLKGIDVYYYKWEERKEDTGCPHFSSQKKAIEFQTRKAAESELEYITQHWPNSQERLIIDNMSSKGLFKHLGIF